MGRTVICGCGQRNDLDVFRFGESRQCLACGQPLLADSDAYKAEEFPPIVKGFEEERVGDFGTANAFESPTALAVEAPPPPVTRSWEGSVRETHRSVNAESGDCCAKCRRAFRGDWDKHQRPEGLLCHLCATQAAKDFVKPEDWQRRELYRPDPPRKVQQAPDPNVEILAKKKRREIVALSIVAVLTLVVVIVFPVEDWIASIFASDPAKAADMPTAWHWVSVAASIGVGFLGHGITLYAALKWTGLLYEGGLEENWGTLTYLSIAFAVMNAVIGANIVTFIVKVLMIAERYPLRMDNGVSFLLTWSLCSLLCRPCTFAINQLLQGIVSAIAL